MPDDWEDYSPTTVVEDEGWEDYQPKDDAWETYQDPEVQLQEALVEDNKRAITLKNMVPYESTSEIDRKMDQVFTGDDPEVTEYNQILNNLDPEQKKQFNQDNLGKPFYEQLNNAKKFNDDTNKEEELNFYDQAKILGKSFAGEASATPGNIAGGIYANYNISASKYIKGNEVIEKYMQDNNIASVDELKKVNPRMAQGYMNNINYLEKMPAINDRLELFRKNNKEWIKSHGLDLTPEEEQQFTAKLGAGFASLPKSFIPGVIAIEVYGNAYEEGKEKGLTGQALETYAFAQAGFQEISERVGNKILGKIFREGGKMLVRAGKGFLSESLQELSQEWGSYGIEKIYGIEKSDQLKQRLWDSFLIGGITGGVAGGGSALFSRDVKEIDKELAKAGVDEKGREKIYAEARKAALAVANESEAKLKLRGYTDKQIKQIKEYAEKGLVTGEEIKEEVKEKPYEDEVITEEGKAQYQEYSLKQDAKKENLLKEVKELTALKKELYGDMDIESPMSLEEKELNKKISNIFSEINSIVRAKHKAQRMPEKPEGEKRAPEFPEPETKYQETPKAEPSKRLLEVAKARELLKPYDVDIDKVKGTYKIQMPDGREAAGKYADDAIYIAHIVKNTTGAHEAFHYFADKFADQELYNKALKETGKTGLEADEYLAEEFGKYRNDKKSVTGKMRQLFDMVMRNLKKVFGKQKYARRLFSQFEKGKGMNIPKLLKGAKYQELTPKQKKYIKEHLNLRINKEMQNMKQEAEGYQRGKYHKGKTVESKLPSWARELGLGSEEEAMTALKKGNMNYTKARKVAIDRIAKGYKDVDSGYDIPADKQWKFIIDNTKNSIGEKTFSEWAGYKLTKEQAQKRAVKEAKKETKDETKKRIKAEERASEAEFDEARTRLAKEKIEKAAKEKTKEFEKTAKIAERKLQTKDAALERLKRKGISLKEFKAEAIEYAKKLPLNERGKLLARIKNMNSLLDRAKTIAYIDKLGAQSQIRTLKVSIKKELKKTKVRKQSGKPVGKYTADIQRVMDKMREATVMTQAQAQDQIAENIQLDSPPIEIALQNKILSIYGGLDEQTAENLEKGLALIKEMKREGRMANELKKLVRSTVIEEEVEDVLKVLTGGKGLPDDLSLKSVKKYDPKTIRDKASKAMRSMGKKIAGYKDVLDMLSSKDKTSAPGESALSQFADVLDEKNAEKKGVKDNMVKVRDMAMRTLKLKNDSEMMDKFNKDLEEVSLGKVILSTGKKMDLTLNRSEARKLFMEFKDPTLRETFDKMGYTDKMRNIIDEFLTDEDKAFANAQLEFYQDYHGSISEVYSEIYGVDLPKNLFYSPIRREGIGKEDVMANEFLNEVALQRSVAPGSTKTRVENTKKIQMQNDISVLEKHIVEMEHFKAWAAKIRDLKAVLGNSEVVDAIKINHDPGLLTVLTGTGGFIDDFISNGTTNRQSYGIIDKLRMNIAKSVLSLKAFIGVKQLTSIPAYADAIPIQHWAKGSAKFWLNPVGNTKMLYDSSILLQNRGKHQERDLAQVAKSQKYEKLRKGKSLQEKMLMNVQLGDQGAIVAGGYAVYDYYKNVKGLSHEQAIKKFEQVTESTQQSADLSEQSYFQRGGSIQKALTMFQSSQNQYFRKELGAVRGILTGRGGKAQHLKTLMIFHLVLPTIFQFVSNGFKWDDDEQKRAAIFGSLNGIFLLGDGFEYIVSKIMGLKTWDMNPTVLSVFKDVGDSISSISSGNYMRATRKAADSLGKLTGLPLKTLVNMEQGIEKIVDGELEAGIKQVMGLSPYVAEKSSSKPASSRSSRSKRSSRKKRKGRK